MLKELLLKLLGLIEAGKLDEAAEVAIEAEKSLDEPEEVEEAAADVVEAVAEVVEEMEPEAVKIEHTEKTEVTVVEPPKGKTGTPGKEPHEYSYKELLALYNASPTDFNTLKGSV